MESRRARRARARPNEAPTREARFPMRLARAGALVVFVAAGAVGAIGIYLTFGLVVTALHPALVHDEIPAASKRTVLTQPVRNDAVDVVAAQAPADHDVDPATAVPGAVAPP